MQVQPYLFFDGRCDEAADFYRTAVGAQVKIERYKDAPDKMGPPGAGDKVMHMSMRIGETLVLASDGHCKGQPNFAGFSLLLMVADDAEAKRYFDALAVGGSVSMPLGKTFFSSSYGMLKDRFGVTWSIYVAQGTHGDS